MNFVIRGPGGIRAALVGCVLLTILVTALGATGAGAHGGYPLSLGTAAGPGSDPLFRLVLVYLREGQGMTVEPLFYENEKALAEAFDGGRVDILVHAPGAEWTAAHCAPSRAGGAEGARENYFAGIFPGSWSSPFAAAGSAVSCGFSIVAHPRVTGDLRFSLLKRNLLRLLESIGEEDISELLREGGAEPRAQLAAARRLLRREGLI